ncbi:MAG TPA: nitrile hydratase subunit beta [Gammaproteobacteria bacterium]|nr:nitrile hydratase subunit beta [Gammaproteobacteria bacterium]
MNGVHDLGGMDGFPLPARDQGFALHEEWERLTWGMLLATLGIPGIPNGNRRFIESLPPARYLTMPYYARFLESRLKSFLDTGLVTQQELDNPDGPVTMPKLPGFAPRTPEEIVRFLRQEHSGQVNVAVRAAFAAGDEVVVKNDHPAGHTRVPRYVRGCRGVILRDHGVHVFEDDVPAGVRVGPQHLYTVKFTGPELWGSRGHARDRVHVELWEIHLSRASSP